MHIVLKVDDHIVSMETDAKPDSKEEGKNLFMELLWAVCNQMEELFKGTGNNGYRFTEITSAPEETPIKKPIVEDTSPKCPRCKSSPKGCEFFEDGICKGIVYPTYPPKYDPCVYDHGEGA